MERSKDINSNLDEAFMNWKNRMADIAVGDKVCYS
jgi:hypothetical protein